MMTHDEMDFVTNLYRIGKHGALGVGMDDPIPEAVRTLVTAGYCGISEIANPHELPNRFHYIIWLTSAARELLDSPNDKAGSEAALKS